MAMQPPGPGSAERAAQGDIPAVATPGVNAVSDSRFMLIEVGRLTAAVDRLISDVRTLGEKVDALRQQAAFVKGGLAISAVLVTAFIAVATFVLNAKWETAIQAIKAISK
jgi:hypothetical protein